MVGISCQECHLETARCPPQNPGLSAGRIDPHPAAKGKLKPLFAFVDGKPEYHPEGVYFLRYAREGKRIWEHAGKDWQLALDAKVKQERAMAAQAVGAK
jgi:hypothetical protein